VQPQPLKSLGNRVKVGGAGGADLNVNLLEPLTCGDDEVQAPKMHDRARGPFSGWLAIHSLVKSSRRAKAPTWCANYRCFKPPTSEFVFARLARMVCKEDTEGYTGSGGMSLRPVRTARILALVRSRGYKRVREGEGSQVSGGEVSHERASV
jgi:hypothetical protein